IADFGLAKLSQEDPASAIALTDSNLRLGTAHYIAPEQLANTSAVDHRADIFGLGVVLYEMLTGERPFTASSPMGVIYRHGARAARRNKTLRAILKLPSRFSPNAKPTSRKKPSGWRRTNR
ncbi:MAG: protein kinase, partial [Nitrospiraceae bacterium]|nr:protein kinase [Nitrospiraceae bacterium]